MLKLPVHTSVNPSNGHGCVVGSDNAVVCEMLNGVPAATVAAALNRTGKLRLPDVTLVIIETRQHQLARMAIENCLVAAEFADVLIFTDNAEAFGPIMSLYCVEVEDWPDKLGWSRFSWQGMDEHVKTSHILHIQWDSWIIDPSAWNDAFLDYDLIGAPWWYGDGMDVGNLGFSLRSKKVLRFMREHAGEFPINTDFDDDLVCRGYRQRLEEHGITWAPEPLAQQFSFECIRPPQVTHRYFGFHGIGNWPSVLSFDQLRERTAIAGASLAGSGHLAMLESAMVEYAKDAIKHLDSLNLALRNHKYFSAVTRLRMEDYDNGFRLYECRFDSEFFGDARKMRDEFKQDGIPQWYGEPLAGKTIMVWHEQGHGDSIMMHRYVPLLERMAERVVIALPQPLVDLFRANGHEAYNTAVLEDDDLDYHCPIWSLPLAFSTKRDTVPLPCMKAPISATKLERDPGRPLIGITWAASKKFPHDDHRSMKFKEFSDLFVTGADFVALQHGLPPEQVEEFEGAGIWNIPYNSFGELASIMQDIDLVITVCSSTANLAGSIGRPMWVLLGEQLYRDMRWGHVPGPSPWYPAARIYRQTVLDDWKPVLDEVRRDLDMFIDGYA